MPFASAVQIEPARSGDWTARVPADDGRPLYVHSRYQPRDEAKRFVASQPQTEAPTFIVFGTGLGYTLVELQHRYHEAIMLVVEPEVGLIKAALCVSELHEAIENCRLVFLTSSDRAALHEVLFRYNGHLLLGFQQFVHPYANRVSREFHQAVRAALPDFLAFGKMQMMTLLRNARVTDRNIVMNLPHYMRQPGVESLAGRAAGYPAILIAAGPSLARQLDLLCTLRDRAVIVAVQTVYKLLLSRGCTPHFVTSLDYHEVSSQFFRDAGESGDCILVAEPKATWHVADAFPGRKRILHSDLVDDLLRDAAPRRGSLKAGSTVAHLSLYLAEHLGCDPIILVGQDLCFSDGLYYPPGMPIEQTWAPELSRFCTIEMKQWERVVRGRSILRRVPNVHGRETYTDDQLFTYAEQFQADFAASRSRIIHAGEAGMRLAHTRCMSLEEAAKTHCTHTLPRELFADQLQGQSDIQTDRAVEALEARLEELREVRAIAEETESLLGRLMDLIERPDDFNRLLARVDDLRMRMLRHDRLYKIVVEAAPVAELRRVSADRSLGAPQRETPDTARRRLNRDREFVRGFLDGCAFLEGLLPRAIARLRSASA
ncbi:MAG: motility associated factor glycosyltransferase family protein [Phycisphaerales bacterium]|nr:motility associated factor glycosyltransferase family protein [Phycisphaerales bacterium]